MMNTVHGTKILLPMSTLTHTYCQKQVCQNDKDIEEILNKMKINLGKDCSSSNEEKVCRQDFFFLDYTQYPADLVFSMSLLCS
jgi:hypothetical protein